MRVSTLSALALTLALTPAAFADEEAMPIGQIKLTADAALPAVHVINSDNDRVDLAQAIKADKATVIKFFDPSREPVYMNEEGEVLPGATTPFTKLYTDFKSKDVTWVFVAVGEPDNVAVLRETWAKSTDEDVRATIAEQLKTTRASMFAEYAKHLKERGIEDYALFSMPTRPTSKDACAPACVIVRGQKIVSHVAVAGNEESITELTSELHLAVNDPKTPRSVPASTPRD